jgi:hypothetical protein
MHEAGEVNPCRQQRKFAHPVAGWSSQISGGLPLEGKDAARSVSPGSGNTSAAGGTFVKRVGCQFVRFQTAREALGSTDGVSGSRRTRPMSFAPPPIGASPISCSWGGIWKAAIFQNGISSWVLQVIGFQCTLILRKPLFQVRPSALFSTCR